MTATGTRTIPAPLRGKVALVTGAGRGIGWGRRDGLPVTRA
ncbi:hypothetical protein [Mycolicibacterium diernhoferi]|nr:hypothetical protein [Mycolicibacterium diernhoferi]